MFLLSLFVFWCVPSLTCIICILLLTTGGMIVIFSQDSVPLQTIVRYVILQEVGTCLFSVGWVSQVGDLKAIGLLLKLGLPPFHVWLLECSFAVTSISLWCLLVSSKLLPLALLISCSEWILGLLYILIGSFAMFAVHTVVNLIVVSSWLIVGWITICSNGFTPSVGLLIYIITMAGVMVLMNQAADLNPSSMGWLPLFIIVGLPLGSIFLINFYLLSEISIFFNGVMVILLLVFSVISTVGYYHVYSLQVQISKVSQLSIINQVSTLGFVSWLLGLSMICLMF